MRYALSPAGRRELARFAARDVLLAFDFDGTLAPIARTPDRARMRTLTRERLRALARLYPCVVITGRARKDALRRLRGLGLRMVVGNHGIEMGDGKPVARGRTRPWLRDLRRRLDSRRGVWIEDKVASLTIHYRLARDGRKAREAILAAVGAQSRLRVVGGKRCVNVLPSDAPGKGVALERARRKLACSAAIYVGDDQTDEDVFARARNKRMLGIRIGQERLSGAAYYLRRQLQIDELLLLLWRLRADKGDVRPRRRPIGRAALSRRRSRG